MATKFQQFKERFRVARVAHKKRSVGPLDVVVCSSGGVASTMLIKHVARFARTNNLDDFDTLKHVPKPEYLLSDPEFGGKILYIYGELDSILASIERRGWTLVQGCKLAGIPALFWSIGESRNAFKKAVETQMEAFIGQPNSRVMPVHFDQIWDLVPEMADFLSIADPRFITEFPVRKQRHTETSR